MGIYLVRIFLKINIVRTLKNIYTVIKWCGWANKYMFCMNVHFFNG